jgi:ParB family transcriptional regulator, chromosome partitioning protein
MTAERPRRLGRGLEALISGAQMIAPSLPVDQSAQGELQRVPIADIRPNPFQPRHVFQEEDLAELRSSLQSSGLLQPVIVRRLGDAYELISGERRLRAAGQLGWERIPALVRTADAPTMLTLALIENLQRTDLNPIEEARGLQRLHDEFALTHQQIAEAIGKDRSTVSNLLRFLSLPDDVQELLQKDRISMGHAKALLALPNGIAITRLAADIARQHLSVRQTERRIRQLMSGDSPITPRARSKTPSHDTIAAATFIRSTEDRLRHKLQTDVKVNATEDNHGSITISFYSADDLDRILELIIGNQQPGD